MRYSEVTITGFVSILHGMERTAHSVLARDIRDLGMGIFLSQSPEDRHLYLPVQDHNVVIGG